jgi:general secretion pathway protein H
MRYQYRGGFTLLELIIVLFIASLALSLVALAVHRSYEKSALRQETMAVQQMLKYARERSLMERVPYSFVVNADEHTYGLRRNGDPVGKARGFHRGLMIEGEAVTFFPKGNSDGGSITISDRHGREYRIEVDGITGKASVGRL